MNLAPPWLTEYRGHKFNLIVRCGQLGRPFMVEELSMNQSKTVGQVDALIDLLKSSLTAEGAQAFGHLVLYTSFGVVRGRIGLSFAQSLISSENDGNMDASSAQEVNELNDATVEHYSNHLPTASFNRLYVRLANVHGFAMVDS